jgi:hypothetical protein
MVLLAAGLLIVVVLIATVLAVGSDVVAREQGQRLHALKDWQALIGAVLGFMGAAGVLVLGTAIDADQQRQRTFEREHAIGLAMALEAERLSNFVAGDLGIINLIHAQPAGQDFAKTCTNFVATLVETLDKQKPVYAAALSQMIEFGDFNLTLFVRYYGYFDDLVEDAKSFDPQLCARDGENQINQFERRLGFAFDLYRDIAKVYGTALVEPQPAELVTAPPATPAPATN